MTRRMLLAAAAAVLVPVTLSAGPMKAGKWKVTIETPTGPHSVVRCITEKEANEPHMPQTADKSCKVLDMKIEAHSISWKMACAKSGISADSKTVYEGDAFKSETHFKMPGGKEMTQRSTGKYMGACDVKK